MAWRQRFYSRISVLRWLVPFKGADWLVKHEFRPTKIGERAPKYNVLTCNSVHATKLARSTFVPFLSVEYHHGGKCSDTQLKPKLAYNCTVPAPWIATVPGALLTVESRQLIDHGTKPHGTSCGTDGLRSLRSLDWLSVIECDRVPEATTCHNRNVRLTDTDRGHVLTRRARASESSTTVLSRV